jgi:CRISPR-associated endoribonuclease Cas6
MFWYISSPWNEFVQNFVNGLLELGGLRIGQHNFPITQTEAITSVNIHNELNKFICLSPIVVTTKREYNGKLCKYYYKPTDNLEEISEKIGQNLINKYKSFYGKEPQNTSLKIEFDKNYIKTPRAQVLSHYIKDDLDIKIPAIMCPFIATGSVELVKFGYECGFGELNSAGFGMVRMV